MPIAFLLVGAVILISVIRNTHKELGTALVNDMTGASGFLIWIAAISILGMIGYIPSWEKPSRAFLGLIVLAMFLANGGFFAKFTAAIKAPEHIKAVEEPKLSGPAPIEVTGAGGSSLLGSITGTVVKGAAAYATGGTSLAATGGL